MDEYLDQAWKDAEPPFDGETVSNRSPLTLRQLGSVRETIVAVVEKQYGRGMKLLSMADSHERDGFRQEATAIELIDLRRMIGTDDRLRQTRTGEPGVYRAVYPVSAEWLLRWQIDDAGECQFTFSTNDTDAAAMADVLRKIAEVDLEPSAGYFRARFGG
jgi:hypothetical protein